VAASPVEEARAPESLACGALLPLTHFLCIKIHVAPLRCGQTHTVAPCWRIEEQPLENGILRKMLRFACLKRRK